MPGINEDIIEYHLNIDLKIKRARPKEGFLMQKECNIDRGGGQVSKAGFIREVNNLEWLANSIIVRRSPTKWRKCTYFINLNKDMTQGRFLYP